MNTVSKVYIFKFILFYLIFESLLSYLTLILDIHRFAASPYTRAALIIFTFFYFSPEILKIKTRKQIQKKIIFFDGLVMLWVTVAVISLFIGLLYTNPTIYLVSDFVYIGFGGILYYIAKHNQNISFEISNFYLKSIGFAICLLLIIHLLLDIVPSSLLMVITVAFIFTNILKKNIIPASVMTVPYLLLVSTTNRTQLIIFLIMIIVLALKLLRKKYNLNFIFMYVFLFTTIIYFFKVEILEWLLKFFENSAMTHRINQLLIIFKEGIDYNSPYLLSVTQRIVEAELVVNYWTTDILSFIFGSGSGGTIDGSKMFNDLGVLNTALLGSEKIHNIHLLPFALIFRYGVFGLSLFVMLLVIIYKSFVRLMNEERNNSTIVCTIFILLWIIYSMPAAAFLWSPPIFWLFLQGAIKDRLPQLYKTSSVLR